MTNNYFLFLPNAALPFIYMLQNSYLQKLQTEFCQMKKIVLV